MAAAAAPAPIAWLVELVRIKEEIVRMYMSPGGEYNAFYTAWHGGPADPDLPARRSRANPYPMTFYSQTARIRELYARAVALVCTSGTYDDLIDLLVWLQTNCPPQEYGRGLYFSNAILSTREIPLEHRTKCAYAYIAGIVQDAMKPRETCRIGLDVIEDTDNGDVGIIHDLLVARVPELSCPALPILAALRVIIYPARYGREARNAAAISDSPWLPFALTIVPVAAKMRAGDIVYAMQRVSAPETAISASWARRRAAVLAWATAQAELAAAEAAEEE